MSAIPVPKLRNRKPEHREPADKENANIQPRLLTGRIPSGDTSGGISGSKIRVPSIPRNPAISRNPATSRNPSNPAISRNPATSRNPSNPAISRHPSTATSRNPLSTGIARNPSTTLTRNPSTTLTRNPSTTLTRNPSNTAIPRRPSNTRNASVSRVAPGRPAVGRPTRPPSTSAAPRPAKPKSQFALRKEEEARRKEEAAQKVRDAEAAKLMHERQINLEMQADLEARFGDPMDRLKRELEGMDEKIQKAKQAGIESQDTFTHALVAAKREEKALSGVLEELREEESNLRLRIESMRSDAKDISVKLVEMGEETEKMRRKQKKMESGIKALKQSDGEELDNRARTLTRSLEDIKCHISDLYKALEQDHMRIAKHTNSIVASRRSLRTVCALLPRDPPPLGHLRMMLPPRDDAVEEGARTDSATEPESTTQPPLPPNQPPGGPSMGSMDVVIQNNRRSLCLDSTIADFDALIFPDPTFPPLALLNTDWGSVLELMDRIQKGSEDLSLSLGPSSIPSYRALDKMLEREYEAVVDIAFDELASACVFAFGGSGSGGRKRFWGDREPDCCSVPNIFSESRSHEPKSMDGELVKFIQHVLEMASERHFNVSAKFVFHPLKEEYQPEIQEDEDEESIDESPTPVYDELSFGLAGMPTSLGVGFAPPSEHYTRHVKTTSYPAPHSHHYTSSVQSSSSYVRAHTPPPTTEDHPVTSLSTLLNEIVNHIRDVRPKYLGAIGSPLGPPATASQDAHFILRLRVHATERPFDLVVGDLALTDDDGMNGIWNVWTGSLIEAIGCISKYPGDKIKDPRRAQQKLKQSVSTSLERFPHASLLECLQRTGTITSAIAMCGFPTVTSAESRFLKALGRHTIQLNSIERFS